MITDKQKTKFFHLLEFIVGLILIAVVGVVALLQLRRGGSAVPVVVTLVVCLAAGAALKLLVIRSMNRAIRFFEGVLDTVPFMLHATDMDMNWTFLNKPTMDFLGLDREEVMGQHCSNWKAVICGTDKCSAYSLRQGRPTTFFQQEGMDLRVDTNWLLDEGGNRIGYVECVQNISETVAEQNKQMAFVGDVSEMCSAFVTASSEISSGAQMLAQGSVQQASAVEELSGSIAEVAQVIDGNVKQAEEAARLSQIIAQDAETGSQRMQSLTQAVGEITEASESIGKVIKVIDDIAFQTNILALNAAVEAARAGAHGKGFAVVADEVRNLAQKSAEAAKDTSGLIENSIEKAKLGARISDETAQALGKIINGVSQSNQLIENISQSSQEQNEAIHHINQGIEQVSMVVQQNSATAEQSASASEELNAQTLALKKLLDEFHAQHAQSAAVAVTETGMRVAD